MPDAPSGPRMPDMPSTHDLGYVGQLEAERDRYRRALSNVRDFCADERLTPWQKVVNIENVARHSLGD